MQAFGSLISPENQGSLDRVDHKRPKILVQNDNTDGLLNNLKMADASRSLESLQEVSSLQ